MTDRLIVELQPLGRRAEAAPGATLLETAQSVGVQIQATCGGVGICGSCRVRIVKGAVSEPDATEMAELGAGSVAAGYRLACRAKPLSDVRIDVPADSLIGSQRLQLEATEGELALEPCVVPCEVTLDPPSLEDVRADATRLGQAIELATGAPVTVGWAAAADLPDRLRANNWRVRAVLRTGDRGSRLVTTLPQGARLLGAAIDVGTTKLALYLVDLETGATLASRGLINPQVAFGEDVISRLAYAAHTFEGGALLQRRITECLTGGIEALCRQANTRLEQVVEVVVVGNTAMHHLFAGLPTAQLGTSPYVAAVTDPLDIPARELGLNVASDAQVYLPPGIAGFVGSDHVAMLLASGALTSGGTVLAIDIGTNTEISLRHEGRLLSCSCPSGPAFEGAHLAAGMRAGPGAIEAVRIRGEQVLIRTIGGQPPMGICGSGILDAVAEMQTAGMLDPRGNFRKNHPLLEAGVLVLAPADGGRRAIVVHRRDVMEVQLAKAAIQSGIATLLGHVGIAPEAVDDIIVAGAFGTYLDVRSAIRLGMFPALPRERFRQVGNAAGLGARQLLVSQVRRREARELARRVEYLELGAQPGYTDRYLKAMWL